MGFPEGSSVIFDVVILVFGIFGSHSGLLAERLMDTGIHERAVLY